MEGGLNRTLVDQFNTLCVATLIIVRNINRRDYPRAADTWFSIGIEFSMYNNDMNVQG